MECIEAREDVAKHHQGQSKPQPCFLEADFRAGRISCYADGEIGNTIAFAIWHGIAHRWAISEMSPACANALMEEVKPMIDRLAELHVIEWDGSNRTGSFGEPESAEWHEASELQEKIEKTCREHEGDLQWADTYDWLSNSEIDTEAIRADIDSAVREQINIARAEGVLLIREEVENFFRDYLI